jgi:hypothetical protein
MGETEGDEMKLSAAILKKLMGRARWPTAWSHSRYASWKLCAFQYFLGYICKLPQPDVPAMERGSRIHKLAEEFLKGNISGMPDDLKKFGPELRRLQRLGVTPEQSWNITATGEPCEWNDWNRVWLRSKIDAHHYFEDEGELVIVDFKTGRHNVVLSQMDLYAWIGPHFYQDAESVRVELWFTDHGETASEDYKIEDLKAIGDRWRGRADRLLTDRKMEPTPGWQCKRCAFRSDTKMLNGERGPCSAWKKAA